MAVVFSEKYDPEIEQSLCKFYHTLSEKDRRRYAAIEARKLGHGGIKYLADLFGCHRSTIKNGLAELDSMDSVETEGRIRRKGAGRKRIAGPDSAVSKSFF